MDAARKSDTSKMVLNEDACYRVVDGEAVILDIQSGEYFNLNETGTEILERAVAGMNKAQIAEELKELYQEQGEHIEADVEELLESLLEQKILLPEA